MSRARAMILTNGTLACRTKYQRPGIAVKMYFAYNSAILLDKTGKVCITYSMEIKSDLDISV